EDEGAGEATVANKVLVLLHVRPGGDDHKFRVRVRFEDLRERVDQGRQVLLRRDAADVEDDIVAVQAPLRAHALAGDVRPEPVRIDAGRDQVRDPSGRTSGR